MCRQNRHFWASMVVMAGLLTAEAVVAQAADRITQQQLLGTEAVTGLADNSSFLPSPQAGPAKHDFAGSLRLEEAEMGTDPSAFKAPEVLGKNPKIFPSVSLSFFTNNGDLVPVDRDVIRAGSTPAGAMNRPGFTGDLQPD